VLNRKEGKKRRSGQTLRRVNIGGPRERNLGGQKECRARKRWSKNTHRGGVIFRGESEPEVRGEREKFWKKGKFKGKRHASNKMAKHGKSDRETRKINQRSRYKEEKKEPEEAGSGGGQESEGVCGGGKEGKNQGDTVGRGGNDVLNKVQNGRGVSGTV